MISEEKLKALNDAMAQIEKTYGKGSVMKLGDENAHMNVEAIPTGSLSLDLALGVGGLPRGRVIEIYGPESSGKDVYKRQKGTCKCFESVSPPLPVMTGCRVTEPKEALARCKSSAKVS